MRLTLGISRNRERLPNDFEKGKIYTVARYWRNATRNAEVAIYRLQNLTSYAL
jgi:hypothetical protein